MKSMKLMFTGLIFAILGCSGIEAKSVTLKFRNDTDLPVSISPYRSGKYYTSKPGQAVNIVISLRAVSIEPVFISFENRPCKLLNAKGKYHITYVNGQFNFELQDANVPTEFINKTGFPVNIHFPALKQDRKDLGVDASHITYQDNVAIAVCPARFRLDMYRLDRAEDGETYKIVADPKTGKLSVELDNALMKEVMDTVKGKNSFGHQDR